MTVKLLTEHHLEFLSLKGGCTGSSESTLVKMPHCWKSHVTAQMLFKGILLTMDILRANNNKTQLQNFTLFIFLAAVIYDNYHRLSLKTHTTLVIPLSETWF